MKISLSRKRAIWAVVIVCLIVVYHFSLPATLFSDSYSTVVQDRDGQLLSAAIAPDGQWRFPESDSVPLKYSTAVVALEDKRFWQHPGVDLLALARAIRQNVSSGRVVSGGSTLTMQVVRLSRKNPPRNIFQKFIEVVLATRLEIRYTKKELLNLYASHAPFGGNVVGIEAACWRYFGRGSDQLSWGEAALLAVLPNNPSLIHLAKNRERLRTKRDRLLAKLFEAGTLDQTDYQLALAEPIPDKPTALPRIAPHLLDRVAKEGHAQRIVRTTLRYDLQVRADQLVNDFHQRLKGNQIFNAAALIVDVQTGEVLAYIGNTRSGAEHQEMVDIIRSPRSTGSILKPFLFAALLEEGKLLPTTLVPDVPTLISGFAPKNFSKQYDGAVSASQALVRSLNVPAVLELRDYRYEKFYNLLQSIGMTTLSKPADHYGLSLVLGGAEGTLWDITGMYASCARILTNYFQRPGQNRYGKSDFHSLQYVFSDDKSPSTLEPTSQLGASSLWSTFETLRELYRPGEETGWQHFSSSKPIAWKTGTSFGSRDGWAVGVTPDYAVGVWVGNADGEGRPGLTGTETAAPLMFEIFSSLPGQTWFQKPLSELVNIPVCALSGKRATSLCQRVDTVSAPNAGLTSGPCTEHALVHLSSDGKYRVHGDCESMDRVKSVSWFVLPPVQEYYFKSRNLSYKPLPPYRKDCLDPSAVAMMDIVYPKANARIYLPVQLTGEQNSAVFEVTHRRPGAIVYWHLDGNFIGTSKNTHRLGLAPSPGKHTLTLVDDSGNSLERYFTILFRQ